MKKERELWNVKIWIITIFLSLIPPFIGLAAIMRWIEGKSVWYIKKSKRGKF